MMIRSKTTVIAFAIAALTAFGGCARIRAWRQPRPPATEDSSVRIAKEVDPYISARNYPLIFAIPNEDVPKAWARGREFVEKYGTLRLKTATDRKIETDEPPPGDVDVAYYVYRRPLGNDMVKITVETQTSSRFPASPTARKARNNAHILACYIATGQLDPSLLMR